ncbi:hypothetical protein [Cerasicoccus maritimus]|uniref:hypothetical protein n=1 Tax=Cerasicoccus maritimus TaxID=490089 RepID=UPI002852A74B|nr:hypothetical protein [Cerasicoccus maritimus]
MQQTPPALPASQDESHLNSLAIAHYAIGGIGVLFACMPLIHMVVGLSFIIGGNPMAEELQKHPEGFPFPPELFGWFFFIAGLVFFLLGQALAISLILSGRQLKRRRGYNFSFVVACINCVAFPIGTALGAITLIVLMRPSVKAIYDEAKR